MGIKSASNGSQVATIPSKRLRNKIAGPDYTILYYAIAQHTLYYIISCYIIVYY